MSDQMQIAFGLMVGGFGVSTWLIMLILLKTDSNFYKVIAPPFLTGGIIWLALTGIGMPPLASYYTKANVLSVLADSFILLFLTGAVSYGALIYLQMWPGRRKSNSNETHRRGQQLCTAAEVAKQLKKLPSRMSVGSVPIPTRDEAKHFMFCGGTGAGKSQAFHQMLVPIRNAGERAIAADIGAEYLRRYYTAGDIIINPFDKRCVDWSPLAEMDGVWDAHRVAASIIPTGSGSAKEWNGYAQTLLACVLEKMFAERQGSNGELVRLLTMPRMLPATTAHGKETLKNELVLYLDGTPGRAILESGADGMVGAILNIVRTYIQPFSYLDPEAGFDGFSFKEWVKKDSGTNWIFLTVQEGQRKLINPLIAAAIDCAICALMSLRPSDTRRLWFSLDEFSSFGTINSIDSLLTKARKYGGCAIVGVQDISQLKDSYGLNGYKTLLSCLGTWLVLRTPDPETADYMSRYIGDSEVRRVVSSGGESDGKQSNNWSEQITQKRVVMPSEISNLADLCGYLNITGNVRPCLVRLGVTNLPDRTTDFEFTSHTQQKTFADELREKKEREAERHADQPEQANVSSNDLPFDL